MRNAVKAHYYYYTAKQGSTTIYVLKRHTDTAETSFCYLAHVAADGQVTLNSFDDPTGERTALQGHVPQFEIIPKTTVQLGQLVTAYQQQRAYR